MVVVVVTVLVSTHSDTSKRRWDASTPRAELSSSRETETVWLEWGRRFVYVAC